MRTQYGVKILLDDDFEDLKKRMSEKHDCTKKTIKGAHTYDILANPLYAQKFQYISAAQENPPRADFIKDGDDNEGNDFMQMDFVRLALNAGNIQNGAFRAKVEGRDKETKIN
jgi:hypothetical protein